jgi:hypothetical protein
MGEFLPVKDDNYTVMQNNKSKDVPLISYELGCVFTWLNPDQPNQKGWTLNEEARGLIADDAIDYFVLALDNQIIRTDGGMGGIEVSVNSSDTGFIMDYKSFPWNWDSNKQTGGYISYPDLTASGYAIVNSNLIYLRYHIKSHPVYHDFKKTMASAEWGEISIQYGIGIRILPYISAYLQG